MDVHQVENHYQFTDFFKTVAAALINMNQNKIIGMPSKQWMSMNSDSKKQPKSFIKIREKTANEEGICHQEVLNIQGFEFNKKDPFVMHQLEMLSHTHWVCDSQDFERLGTLGHLSKVSKDKVYSTTNFETYKHIKEVSEQLELNLSKEQMYDKLLKPFRHRKIKVYDFEAHRHIITYVWDYEGCGKEFNKTWNLLDHVRMHEGIKPYTCEICNKEFTQKGNLRKHMIIQHSTKSLSQRKKYKCNICGKRYTERYNLVVSTCFWDIS